MTRADEPRILGVVLAGGRSRRFGSDKALALLEGRRLIDHAIDALAAQCATVAVLGRPWQRGLALADRPACGIGPLAGLAAALHHAAGHGFASVLCVACDTVGLPADLAVLLGDAPAVADGQWTIGHWPAGCAPMIDAHIAAGGRSLAGWARHAGARCVVLPPMRNINTPADLG
jgi:molybdenum cofactor guanylyltransferase